MTELIPYPKSVALDKVEQALEGKVVRIEEKIDGSNVGIHKVDDELILQSRNLILDKDKPGSFSKFVAWVKEHEAGLLEYMHDGELWYGETVGMGKLRYPNAPPFILFDILHASKEWSKRAHFPPNIDINIPLYVGLYQGIEHVRSFLGPSQYNGAIEKEGVVVKATNVTLSYTNKTTGETMFYTEPLLVAKLVREDYKEVKAPVSNLANVADPLDKIAESVVTSARVDKAIQRLEEEGRYDRDKPHQLIPIVAKDVHDEEQDLIKDLLFQAYWKSLTRKMAALTVELARKG